MSVYEFKCQKCERVFTRFIDSKTSTESDRQEAVCRCGEKATRIWNNIYFNKGKLAKCGDTT